MTTTATKPAPTTTAVPAYNPVSNPASPAAGGPCGEIPGDLPPALAALKARNPKARPEQLLPDVPLSHIPRHVAIIMDGNGRWAKARGFPRAFGHRNGAKAVREIIEQCLQMGVEVLTLYSFSLENWKRPTDEVDGLMALYLDYMRGERDHMMAENIRFVQIGRREGLPPEVLALGDEVTALTAKNTALTLCLAVNYGSRAEITDAVRTLTARCIAEGRDPETITEDDITGLLATGRAGLPDPDLLIRTAGEMRVSNFLLWQISYAEIYVTPTLWPDFGGAELAAAIRDFAARERRFGGLAPAWPNTPASAGPIL